MGLQYGTLFSLSHPPSHPTAAAEADLFAAQYGPRALAEDIVCVEDRHLAAAGKHLRCESPSPTAAAHFLDFVHLRTLGRDFVRKGWPSTLVTLPLSGFNLLQMLVRQRRLQLSRSILPIITSDDNGEHTQKERAHKKRISVSLIIIIHRTFLFGLIVITSVFVIKAGLSSHYNHQIEHDTIARQSLSKLPLSKFSELKYALANSDLVALYFAASWCPMSTPISIALDLAFGNGDILLTNDGIRKELSIVYVSSDKTLDTFNGYIHNRKWRAVPFDVRCPLNRKSEMISSDIFPHVPK